MNKAGVLFLTIAVAVSAHSKSAHATCSNGFTQYLAGQIADIVLTSGVASTMEITPYYVAFSSAVGECGIFARTTVPGTTITATYGCPSNCVRSAGQWAAVGSAYPVFFDTVQPNAGPGDVRHIPLAFDGSAAVGTKGFLELAYSNNDFGDLSTAFIFARVPIYVESGTPSSGWNRVTSTASNVSGTRMVLSHPYLDGEFGCPFVRVPRIQSQWE